MAGTIIAWGIGGPLLVKYGVCIGIRSYEDDPHWSLYTSFTSLSKIGQRAPSPRYWFLWPGVMIMVCASMAELFIQYKTIWHAFKTIYTHAMGGINNVMKKRGKNSAFLEKQSAKPVTEDHVEDFATPEQQVPGWLWGTGIIVTLVVTCAIGAVQYDMNVGLNILASLLGFIFACEFRTAPTFFMGAHADTSFQSFASSAPARQIPTHLPLPQRLPNLSSAVSLADTVTPSGTPRP